MNFIDYLYEQKKNRKKHPLDFFFFLVPETFLWKLENKSVKLSFFIDFDAA